MEGFPKGVASLPRMESYTSKMETFLHLKQALRSRKHTFSQVRIFSFWCPLLPVRVAAQVLPSLVKHVPDIFLGLLTCYIIDM